MNEAQSQENSSKFSDIGEILGILRKRKGIILWTTVICAVIALFTSVFIISPKYSSSTDILVNRKIEGNQANAQAQIQADVQMISTYKDIITSPTILNDVSKELNQKGYDINSEGIKKCINITNQQNSQVFTLTVKTKNANLSADIANTTAKVFKQKVKNIMSVNNVSILSKATANPKPVSPKVMLNTLAGILVGLILGLVLAFVANGLDRTITDESFITDTLGLNDLGIISEIPASKVKKMLSISRTAQNISHTHTKRRV